MVCKHQKSNLLLVKLRQFRSPTTASLDRCDKDPILVFCDTTIFSFKKELENVKKWYKMVYI